MDSINIILMKKNACFAENPHMATDVCRLLHENIYTEAAQENVNIAEK